jgi:cysteine desulfurase/selenocysteine lyase
MVREYINAASTEEIIFTRGTTEAINLVASSFGGAFSHGDEIIITAMEHHANIVPWQLIQRNKRIHLRVVPINDKGEIDMQAYEDLFTENTRFVAISHVSNVLGTVNPVKEMIHIAHKHSIPVLVDGAQAVSYKQIDVQDLKADFYAFSAHKMYGPTGIGVLYGKKKFLEQMPPYQGGGEMIGTVSFEKTTFAKLPYKFEAGTPDFVGIAAFAEAIRFIKSIGIENIAAHEDRLMAAATEGLMKIPGMKIYGTSENKSAVISFLVNNINSYDMGTILDKLGIAVRTGHHCAEPLMHRLGVEGTVRASFGIYNTMEEVEQFVAAVERVAKMFG